MRRSIYLDDVNLSTGVYLLIYSIIKNVDGIHFWTADKRGYFFLSWIEKLRLCHYTQKLEVDFSSAMPDGGGLWYWVEVTLAKISKTIAQQFSEIDNFLLHLPGNIEPKRRFGAIRKLVDQELYRTITLALLAKRMAVQSSRRQVSVILVDTQGLLKFAKNTLNDDGQEIEFLTTLNLRASVGYWFTRFFFRQFGISIQYVCAVLRGKKPSEAKLKHMIALQYVFGIDDEQRMNDLWWFDSSGIPNDRLLLYFNRSKVRVTDERVNELNYKGIDYSILADTANGTSNTPTNKYLFERIRWVWPDILSALKVFLLAGKMPAPFWQVKHWLRMMFFIREMQAFIKAENIKIIFDVSETGFDIAALAADMAGAIKIGTHWSDLSYNRTRVIPLQHIYFIWGPLYQQIIKDMDSAGESVLIGSIYDDINARAELRSKGLALRQDIEKTGVKFLVGVLDRSDSIDSHVPPVYHRIFYSKLLDWAEKDSSIGLLIKPKYQGVPRVIASDTRLNLRFQEFLQSGRGKLIDGMHHVVEAGFGSDITVALGLNSGGMLCALNGLRTIYWDPTHASTGPLCEQMAKAGWNNPNTVFEDLDVLIDTIQQYRRGVATFTELGIALDQHLAQVDNFRDGRAAKRMGEVVSDLLVGFDRGLGRAAAIDFALSNYRGSWQLTEPAHWEASL